MNMLMVALIVAFCVALGKAKFAYSFVGFNSILGLAFLIGLCMGDVPQALIVGTAIQAVYLGFTQSGGVISSDAQIATAITIPIVLNTGLDQDAALALAVPVGALAASMTNVIYLINGVLYRDAMKKAEKGDTRGIMLDATLFPILIRGIMYGAIVFVGIYFGSSVIQAVLDVVPQWLIDGFSVAGGILPIIGFALVLNSMNRRDYIPYFIIGFFVMQYFDIKIMAVAIFTICLVIMKFFLNGEVDLSVLSAKPDQEREHLLTKRDVTKLYWRWWWFVEVAHSFEGMQALARCNAFIPVLKKLYPDKEDLIPALQRHIGYFNTNGEYGTAIFGIAMAMEEENALTHKMSNDELDMTLNGIATGLMGPLAGVGDTLDWGTWNKILIGVAMSYTATGSVVGVAIYLIGFLLITNIEGLFSIHLGYRLGSNAVAALFDGGFVKVVKDAAGLIGMVMMGALASQYASFSFANETVQKIFDAVAPNIIVLILVFFIYWLISKKTKRFGLITLGIIVAALLLSFLGIAAV